MFEFGKLSFLDTHTFLSGQGMTIDQELNVDFEPGKQLVIRLLSIQIQTRMELSLFSSNSIVVSRFKAVRPRALVGVNGSVGASTPDAVVEPTVKVKWDTVP